MNLKAWRKLKSKTLADVAADLGIGGSNPSRTIHRYENGEVRVDVPLVDKIMVLTEGAVTYDDFFKARREFLARQAAARPSPDTEQAA